jgi:hypothetical protein
MLHVFLLGGDEVIVGRLLDRDGDVLLWWWSGLGR